jgi:hypothetical protein
MIEIVDLQDDFRTETLQRPFERALRTVSVPEVRPFARKRAVPDLHPGWFLPAGHEIAPFRAAQGLDLPAHLPQQFVQAEPECADPGNSRHGKKRNLAG